MRTLTLGVLIVSGGTLAALPFRRYQAIPDASSAPAHVTGPTQSALDNPPQSGGFQSLVAADAPAAVIDESVLVRTLTPLPRQVPIKQDRHVEIPLTYEDLTQPIDPPVAIEKRFSATVNVRAKQLEQERVAGLLMPSMDSLAEFQQEELKRVAEKLAANEAQAKAALASSPRRDKTIERLPKATPRSHQRHWIRQPN